ncbi:hypothetical protein [Herbiconiux sp. YIM B11900]|uniref:hypothetical protein n=1 Tax=Herbiconiux sp. YIM B11900 TaxID=3404131 RepID=UPI003F83059A
MTYSQFQGPGPGPDPGSVARPVAPPRPALTARQKRGATLGGLALGAVVACFAVGLGAAVLIAGWTMDVDAAVQSAAPVLVAATLVLLGGAWAASWGLLRRHGVAHPVAVTGWSLAIVVVVAVLSAVLAGLLAVVFGALSFVFTMSGQAIGPIVVVAALAAAVPPLLAGWLSVAGLSRAYRPAGTAVPAAPFVLPAGASPPATPPGAGEAGPHPLVRI